MKIKRLHKNAIIPHYQTQGAAGFDLHSIEDVCIAAGGIVRIRLGIAVEIESGYELQIRSRSGLAFQGITVLNSPGTVDSDYRGELQVILMNHSKQDFDIRIGDRIAQGVLARVCHATFDEVEELTDTKRADNGFGSTGIRE